jgi:hypothetical protein
MYSLGAHKKKFGKKGIANNCKVVGRDVRSFFDLRVDHQRRIWEGIVRPKDALHPKVNISMLSWKGV